MAFSRDKGAPNPVCPCWLFVEVPGESVVSGRGTGNLPAEDGLVGSRVCTAVNTGRERAREHPETPSVRQEKFLAVSQL